MLKEEAYSGGKISQKRSQLKTKIKLFKNIFILFYIST